MSNEINARQNTEHALCYLAAQRQLYNEAKTFAFYECIFLFISSSFIPICQYFNINIVLENIILISIAITVINLIISDNLQDNQLKLKSTAATLQQFFDIYVYNMEWDTKLFGKRINLNDIIAKKSKRILSNPKEKNKLLNWYTNIDAKIPLNEGILMCQKQNCVWDINLRNRFIKFCLIIGIIFIIIITLFINKDISLIILIPIIKYLYTLRKQLKKNIKDIIEINTLIHSTSPKTMDILQEIQSKIYSYRKSAFCIPNKFYKLFKDDDENTAHRMTQLDKEDLYLK